MAYRRRQGPKSSTFEEEIPQSQSSLPENNEIKNDFSSSSSSVVAQAKASASGGHAFDPASDHHKSKNDDGDSKTGFWGVLAQRAKSIIDDDINTVPYPYSSSHATMPQKFRSYPFSNTGAPESQSKPSYQQHESHNLGDNPTIRKGLEAITSSLNHLGDTFEKAFEEGRMIVESKTAELKTQIRLKGSHEDNESQLKASREVAMATAAKAKLLLRELKTVKADLAFAKARCSQLEEENKMLRDRDTTTTKGQNREDDDMVLIRFQLETLLAEKTRLAGENEVYARENRFLREIVEYHQLTMQDVVYLDDGIAEVPEVYDSSSGVSRITSFNPSPSESPLRVVIRNSESSPILPNEMLTVIEKDSKSASENEAPLPSVSASPK
ncbi:uncharacterized protein LOC107485406 isoform X1 [Arachis duranensis]|uniref:Uncharacterized protein LOC107485406 isoform X1 n=1 Tax=Arachis duranensis TaxID=130453 RepID=A0A9C6TMJ4_ARADU|nr:uncharacterized protein LOC107485406 isoform X1 [Arachis duranensis]